MPERSGEAEKEGMPSISDRERGLGRGLEGGVRKKVQAHEKKT